MKTYTIAQIDTVAVRFVERLQAFLPPEKWEAVQSGEHPNDVCDANHFMIEAYSDIFGREPFFPSDAEEAFCTEAEVDQECDFLDAVWDASAFLRIRRAEWTVWPSALAAAEAYGFQDETAEEDERDSQAEAQALVFLRDETAVIEISSGVLVRDF